MKLLSEFAKKICEDCCVFGRVTGLEAGYLCYCIDLEVRQKMRRCGVCCSKNSQPSFVSSDFKLHTNMDCTGIEPKEIVVDPIVETEAELDELVKSATVGCEECDGTGRLWSGEYCDCTGMIMCECENCGGNGVVADAEEYGFFYKCKDCDGNGIVYTHYHEPNKIVESEKQDENGWIPVSVSLPTTKEFGKYPTVDVIIQSGNTGSSKKNKVAQLHIANVELHFIGGDKSRPYWCSNQSNKTEFVENDTWRVTHWRRIGDFPKPV